MFHIKPVIIEQVCFLTDKKRPPQNLLFSSRVSSSQGGCNQTTPPPTALQPFGGGGWGGCILLTSKNSWSWKSSLPSSAQWDESLSFRTIPVELIKHRWLPKGGGRRPPIQAHMCTAKSSDTQRHVYYSRIENFPSPLRCRNTTLEFSVHWFFSAKTVELEIVFDPLCSKTQLTKVSMRVTRVTKQLVDVGKQLVAIKWTVRHKEIDKEYIYNVFLCALYLLIN